MLAVLKRHPILQTKNFPFEQAFPCYSQKPAFFAPKAFLLYKPSLIVTQSTPFPPSAFHSHPAITYCPPKNTAVLLISALTPYAVKPEPRTDSNHCRRYPETCSFQHSRLPDERRSLSQKHRIDRRFESWVAGLRPACFLVTFCTTQKVTTRIPLQETPRFSKPRISAPQPQLRTATIKTFLRELQGSANLKSAHKITNSCKPIKSF